MSDVRELYQEMILDHCRSPRNRRVPEGANCCATGNNPLCGDQLDVHLRMAGDRIAEIGFQGHGCAISTASASLMTESVRGKSRGEVEALFHRLHDLVTGKADPATAAAELGKLVVFGGVSEFPLRVKCATLAWHTLRAALEGEEDSVVSTE